MNPNEDKISLHGLGFVQVPLGGNDNRRLHVWHPDLPRRACFEHSSIHDHRFGFTSQVLVGEQINTTFRAFTPNDALLATHIPYLHEGERTEFGNRPWIPQAPLHIRRQFSTSTCAGEQYIMPAYEFHSTTPGGDGRVATIMTKTRTGERGARSLCAVGIEPDADFDRHQWSPDDLWRIVREVLEG